MKLHLPFFPLGVVAWLCTGLLLLPGTGGAQQPAQPQLLGMSLIPPSPEAANLGRWAATPISYYTGAAQISLPLHQVRAGGLQVPLSVTYNTTGQRVEEVAGWTGLGWTLNAGGVVTRVVRGRPDDLRSPGGLNFLRLLQTISPFAISTNASYLESISHGCYDAQPDDFFLTSTGIRAGSHSIGRGRLS